MDVATISCEVGPHIWKQPTGDLEHRVDLLQHMCMMRATRRLRVEQSKQTKNSPGNVLFILGLARVSEEPGSQSCRSCQAQDFCLAVITVEIQTWYELSQFSALYFFN